MNDSIRSRMSIRTLLILMLILLAGCVIGYLLRGFPEQKPRTDFTEMRQSGWEYINPLLDCDRPETSRENNRLKPFKQDIERLIQNRINKMRIDEVSVYFRGLNDGPWFTIGPTEKFFPASLMKVPVMISVLKQAEADPSLLKKAIRYKNPALKSIQNSVPKTLVLGRSYTVDELLRRMIIYSDNVSTYLLENSADLGILSRTYLDLGLSNPYYKLNHPPDVIAEPSYLVSAPTYASFFRVLYNSSYLSRAMSEKGLKLLSESDFKEGLVAGVPADIKVAHKFGYRESGEIKQLHDCGIVYYPESPYLLCIMTSGKQYDDVGDAIREVSRRVYENVDRQHRNQ